MKLWSQLFQVSLVLFVVYCVYNLSVLIKYLWSKTVKLGIVSEFCLIIELWRACCLCILCLLMTVQWKLQSEMRRCTNIWYLSIQVQYAEVAILLCELGWCDQCQLLYHKWCCVWSCWWNTQSHAACCLTRDTELDSVNIYFMFCANSFELSTYYACTVINTNNKQCLRLPDSIHTSPTVDIIFS